MVPRISTRDPQPGTGRLPGSFPEPAAAGSALEGAAFLISSWELANAGSSTRTMASHPSVAPPHNEVLKQNGPPEDPIDIDEVDEVGASIELQSELH